MRTYISFFSCISLFIFGPRLSAQTIDIPPLPLAFYYDAGELPAELSGADADRIRATLVRLFGDRHLLASIDVGQGFSVHPRLDVLEAYDGEGMRNLRFIKAELSITLRESNSGINLGGFDWTLTGSGQTQRQAMLAVLRKIPREDARFLAFLDELRPRLNAYYAANCDAIISRADRLIISGDYDKAIVHLMNVPTEASECGQQAEEKLQHAYDEFQRLHCGPILQEARAAMSGRQYDKALDLLLMVSPNSVCAEDATAMMNRIEQTKNQWHAKKFEFAQNLHLQRQQQQLQSDLFSQQLSLQRWVTVGEVAKAVGSVADIFNPSIDLNFKFR